MDLQFILAGFAGLLALGALAFVAYSFFIPKQDPVMRDMLRSQSRGRGSLSPNSGSMSGGMPGAMSGGMGGQVDQSEIDYLKKQAKKKSKKKPLTQQEKFFQAGIFDKESQSEYDRFRIICPVVTLVIGIGAGFYVGGSLLYLGPVMGILVGLQIPITSLNRKIKSRQEDVLFYLPLVIEQIAIGVSSSLDIGPCIARVVSMADERDSHNSVTELLKLAQYQIKSGVSFNEAVSEIGIRSGSVELKHAFMSLAQVAKHGGEITRQLQELADSIAKQRETKIEEKIKKLELEATGPVALVFCGFLVVLLIGFGIQIRDAFT